MRVNQETLNYCKEKASQLLKIYINKYNSGYQQKTIQSHTPLNYLKDHRSISWYESFNIIIFV